MTVSYIPIWIVDVLGALCMILLSFLSIRQAHRLRRRDPRNIVWAYLLWVCYALALFAVSRSAGHILKQFLIHAGRISLWQAIQPFSGGVNTFTFIVVGAVTLFFARTWNIYQQILKDTRDLQTTRDELLYVNQNLESLVAARTRALAASEQKYRRIFEGSLDMILVTRKDGLILDINPAGRRLLGCGPDEALIRQATFQRFLFSPAVWKSILQTVTAEGVLSSAEIDLRRKDDVRLRVLVSGRLDNSTEGGAETIQFLIKDIEQRRMMQEQIAQADKLASIGQLSAGIAHEINNPLSIILGYTQLLLRSEPADTERRSDLKTIEKHVRSCKSIVEDLLNFARSSKQEKDAVRIDECIEEVLQFIQQHAGFGEIEIQREYAPSAPEMMIDEKKIRQVFINLIMNAKYAMGKSGILTVSTAYDPIQQHVTIQVQDTGHGIAARDLPRIFDPFFTTKPTGEGTGLGLSVSYGIIKNHGGHIHVESRAGRGAAFVITLPVTAPAQRSSK